MKGQFMIISAVIASLIIITLSTTISNIQDQRYEADELPKKVNQIKTEIDKVTDDGITSKEERNFRKMLGYMENYQTTVRFNNAENCIAVTLQSTNKRVEIPCTS